VCGLDEAGRGPIAGPVVAGAFLLFPHYPSFLLEADDSKKLSEITRQRIFSLLRESDDLVWGTGIATVEEIDQINIYQASCLAMQRAVSNLQVRPDYLIVDAVCLKETNIPQCSVTRGDQTCLSIALASVVAKVMRDDIMKKLAEEYPAYGWEKNKGYPTAAHLDALEKYGPTPYHRRSFYPLKKRPFSFKPLR